VGADRELPHLWLSDSRLCRRAAVWGPRLVGLVDLSLIVAGLFVTDPGEGYPPGAPLSNIPRTWHGWVHAITGTLFFMVVLPAACFVLSRRFATEPHSRGWATYSWMTGAHELRNERNSEKEERQARYGLLGPPTKYTTLRSVESLRSRSQRRYLLQKTASFLSVSSQLLHRINLGS
jgi:hypothetical protein